MTCKKKKINTSVITAPCANVPLPVLLVTGTPSAWARLLLGTQAGGPAAGISKRASETGASCPPLTALLVAGLCTPARRSPGSGWDPHASWACRPAHLALALATRGAGGQKTRRSLPARKRQPVTPQKKTAFPSVSLQTSGRQGPGCGSLLSTQQGPSTPRTGELGANSCLLQAGPARSTLLAGPRLERETQKACGNDDVSAATFHFLYTVHVCLPIVSVKKPLWIKSTSKTSHMITIL